MDQESNITDIYKYLESTDNIFSLFSASGFFSALGTSFWNSFSSVNELLL